MCSCGLRPRTPGQRKCGPCHSEYMRLWRAGKVEMMLTEDEAQLIRQLRAGRAASR